MREIMASFSGAVFDWDDSHYYAHTEAKYTGIMPVLLKLLPCCSIVADAETVSDLVGAVNFDHSVDSISSLRRIRTKHRYTLPL